MYSKANEKSIKWQPEHFPVGTVVVLRNYVRRDDEFITSNKGPFAEVTVARVIQNGADSYLIETTDAHKALDILYSFHFDHVQSIVKRGNAALTVDLLYSHRRKFKFDSVESVNHGGSIGSKQTYRFYNKNQVLQHLISQTSLPGNLKIKEGFTAFFLRQTFVKKTEDEYFTYYTVDKKKAKRFVQQNINRWIESKKTVRAQVALEQKREYEEYCKDFDREFYNDLNA